MERKDIIFKLRRDKFTMDDCLNIPYNCDKETLGRFIAEVWYELYRATANLGGRAAYKESLNNIADVLVEFWEEDDV